MRGAVVRKLVGATKHGNENRRYDLLSPAHAAAGGALAVSNFLSGLLFFEMLIKPRFNRKEGFMFFAYYLQAPLYERFGLLGNFSCPGQECVNL